MANINLKEFGKQNVMVFARTYFSHYLKTNPCGFHRELCELLQGLNTKRGGRLAVAAPRGSAKSTFVSLIYVLWCICYSKEQYIVLLSDTSDQAEGLLGHVKNELENNEHLRRDFPEACIAEDDKKLGVWKKEEIVTKNNIKVTALGAGQKIRGRRHQEHRPTLIILDDIENDENTQNGESMDKLNEWFERAVLKAGTTTTDVVLVGTIQHYGCLLSRLTKEEATGWNKRIYRSVISSAKREDLWAKWFTLYRGLDCYGQNEGAAAAADFFKDNEKEMMDGVSVLWPEKESYQDLMVMREEEGESSFNAEKQNEPVDPKNAFFKWDGFQFWDQQYRNEEELRSAFGDKLAYYAAVDPSLGKPGKRGDYSAIVVIAKHVDTKAAFVLVADIAKRSPDNLVQAVINLGRFYRFSAVFVEANQFQELLVRDIEERAYSMGISLNIQRVTSRLDKLARIQGLEPWITQGKIKFAQMQKLLLDQFRHFPKGAHDDGPDALEMAISGPDKRKGGFVIVDLNNDPYDDDDDDEDDGPCYSVNSII